MRNRFGIPGIIAVIALVFAMAGGALAAKKYVITSTNQIKPNVLKKLKGAKGRKGAQGPAGPAGAQGPAGAKGDKGDAGARGSAGEAGAPGAAGAKGATGAAGAAGLAGATGATGVDGPAGAAGATGATGPEGVCSTSACALPKGVTIRGTWAANYSAAGAGESIFVPISLSIPAATAQGLPLYMKEGETEDKAATPQCKGGAANPVVEPAPSTPSGNTILCVFATKEVNWTPVFAIGSVSSSKLASGLGQRGGAVLEGKSAAAGPASAYGVWVAMTKP